MQDSVKRYKYLAVPVLLLFFVLLFSGYVVALVSDGFVEQNNEIYDEWNICRTRSYDDDGFYQISGERFRPVIVFESLGDNVSVAYRMGEKMARGYPDSRQCAEQIFTFVRDSVYYSSDKNLYDYEEYAVNADEMAGDIYSKGKAYGDCEDSAVLMAVMFKGAGLRSALVVSSGHTAALVYLPGYTGFSTVFRLDGEPGWVWAEATGRNNPLGWIPAEFINTSLPAYELRNEDVTTTDLKYTSTYAVPNTEGQSNLGPLPALGVLAAILVIAFLTRRRGAKNKLERIGL